ncbi:MAG: MmgE/PrpD family protein [Lachnospiraceae bacterium]|nr:MmgE/PrpD family protein [Lachnospiraceae bacterium]
MVGEERTITDSFVDLLFEMSHRPLLQKIIEKSRYCLLDYVGVTLGGCAQNKPMIKDFLLENPSEGNCHIIGANITADSRTAAMINAYNSHTLELDDGHRAGMLHLAAPIFSGLLSAAEEKECTLPDILKGIVIGYEAAVRVACAIQPEHKKRGFHATGTCGAIGCAMAIAAMRNYSRAEFKNVLCAAASSGAGLLEVTTGSSMQKPYNVVNAASAGMNAALFGRYLKGPEDILGGSRGFIYDFSDGSGMAELVKKKDTYAIEEIYVKPYAACRHCHAPVEAVLNLRKRKNLQSPDSVKAIQVITYGLAVYGHDHTRIEGVNSAKMSIPYSVAAAWLYQQCSLEEFSEERIRSGQILELAKKVSVKEAPELSALVPQKRAAIVTVIYEDGTSDQCRVDYPKGEPENPISKEELMDKFYSIARSSGYQKEWCDKVTQVILKENR